MASTTVTMGDLLICPACGADKEDRRVVCTDCVERLPAGLRAGYDSTSWVSVNVRRAYLRRLLKWARKQPGSPEWLDYDAILNYGYTPERESRFPAPEYRPLPKVREPESTKFAVCAMPDEELIEIAERATRAAALHIARAKASIDQVGQMFLRQLQGDAGVDFTTPLVDAVGGDETLRVVNALEEAGLITVGDLLDCFTKRGLQMPRVPNVGAIGLASVLAAVVRRFLGGRQPEGSDQQEDES